MNKNMQSKINFNFPQKSLFGFKILSSLQSSIACYILIFFGIILNPFFGIENNELIAGTLFNFILNTSITILIINLFLKRKEIKKTNFVILNILLFIYLPIALENILREIINIFVFFVI